MENAVFISLEEFSKRLSVSQATALQIARSSALCDSGIAVNLKPDNKRGLIRIDWDRYYRECIKKQPALNENKRIRR